MGPLIAVRFARRLLVRELKDVAGKRPIFETIATQGQGVVELLDGLFTG